MENSLLSLPEPEAVIEEVRRLAAEDPNKIYQRSSQLHGRDVPQCFYRPTPEEPDGCIMGQAFRNLGFLGIDLPIYDGMGVDSFFDVNIMTEDNHPVAWLVHVQNEQDMGQTWEKAVATADHEVELEHA